MEISLDGLCLIAVMFLVGRILVRTKVMQVELFERHEEDTRS